MIILYTKKEAFEHVKKYLEINQYLFETWTTQEGFFIKVLD